MFFNTSIAAPPPNAPMAMPVETAIVKSDTVTVEATAVGSLRSEESVMIRSEIAGRVLTIHFAEGQFIEAGKPLITLDSAEYQAQLAESTATVNLNKLNFERTKDIYNKNLVSHQAYDEARAKLDESLARQALDRVRLEKTVIHAPFKGTMGLRSISAGAYIKAGDDLVTLGDASSVKLDFRVSEVFVPQVKVGQTVTVRVDALPQQEFKGKLYATDTAVDMETRTILLRARIPNPKAELVSGMFARVSLTLEQHKNALLIPEQALVPQGTDNFVFKVVDGKAMLTKITLGQRRTGDVEVLQGLSAQDEVVVNGQMKLRNGAPVINISAMRPPAKP